MIVRNIFFCFIVVLVCTACSGKQSSTDDGDSVCQPKDLDCLIKNFRFLAGNKNPAGYDAQQYQTSDIINDGDELFFSCLEGYLITTIESTYQSYDCSESYHDCALINDCMLTQDCGDNLIVSSENCGYDPCPGSDKSLTLQVTCTQTDTNLSSEVGNNIGHDIIENLNSDTIKIVYGDIADLPAPISDSYSAPQIDSCTASIALGSDYAGMLEIEYNDPFGFQPSFGIRLCERNCSDSACCSSRTKFTPPIADYLIYGNWRTYTYMVQKVAASAELTMQIFPVANDYGDFYHIAGLAEYIEGWPDSLVVGQPCEIDLTINHIYSPPDQAWFDRCAEYENFLDCVNALGNGDSNSVYGSPESNCEEIATCRLCNVEACTREVVSGVDKVEAWYETSDDNTYSCGFLTVAEAESMETYCSGTAEVAINHCCSTAR